MMEEIRQWFPVALSLISVIGGYFTLKAKVDEVVKQFSEFLNKEYEGFKTKQEKYIQEHYDRLMKLEIKAAATEVSQAQINMRMDQQYMDIKNELKAIKDILAQGHKN